MKKHIGVIILATVIVLILVLYMVSFTVRFNHSALVLTFGKISRQVHNPGLQWKWPWPFQSVAKFDRRIRTYHRQAEETQTRDKQPIVVTVYVNWRVNNEVDVFYNRFSEKGGADPENLVAEAEEMINGWMADAKNIVSEYNLSELVTLDAAKFKLAALETAPQSSMLMRLREKAQAGDGYGIEIVDVGISQLGVPERVTDKVFGRMISERDKESRTLIAQGESAAQIITGDAQSEEIKILADAQAQAEIIKGQGDAQAAQYYEKFSANPEFANFLRKVQTLTKTLSERTTLILDSDNPAYELLKEGPKIVIGDLQQANKDKEGDRRENQKIIKD